MEEIKINLTSDKGWVVEQGNNMASELGWDEMLGLIASMTIGDKKPLLQWLKPNNKI